jgi:hypothetical protein
VNQPLICAQHSLPVVAACARCGDFGCATCLPAGRRVCPKCGPDTAADQAFAKPDLGKGINWVFQDPRWLPKVLTGAACMLFAVFIVPMLLFMGYALRIARREREAPQRTLPEWSEEGLLGDGFKFLVASMLPGMAFMLIFAILGGGGAGLVVLSQGSKQAQQMLAAGFVVVVIAFMVLILPLALFFAYLQPAMRLNYLRTGRITAMLELGAVWKIAMHRPGDYFMLAVSCFVTQMLANFAGQLLCGIGGLVTIPWALYVDSWLVGRYWAWLDAQEQFSRGA